MKNDVSCRALIPILEYAKKNGIRIDRITRNLPVDIQYLENPKNWIARDWFVSIFYRCEEIFKDPLIMYRIGIDGWSYQRGAYSSFIRFLLNPYLFLKFVPKILSLHTNFFKLQTSQIDQNVIKFRFSYSDSRMAHRHGCLFNLGWAFGLPRYVWRTESKIIEQECVCDCEMDSINVLSDKPEMIRSVKFGSKECVFLLKWKKISPYQSSSVFINDNETLIEETLVELFKAESNSFEEPAGLEIVNLDSKRTGFDIISPREMDIVKLVVQGNKNNEIANQLGISNETVKKHLNNIYKKLRVKSRFELIAKIHNHKN